MSDEAQAPRINIKAEEARRFVTNVLIGNGVPQASAETVARCLVEADLRGVDTHGANRIPSYMKRIRNGVLDPKAVPTVKEITPVVCQVDGHNSFGFLPATLAMEKCIEMAKTYGIGMASIKHSNHYGMAACYALQAVRENMMSLVFTNSSPAMTVWGGREKLMGVSPIAAGAPGGPDSIPFIMDMAPSVAARGKVHRALRRGEKIPTDWALDGEGKNTDDPAKALEGVMLPMGGPKGSALSVWMDVFSGVMSGSAFAGHVVGPFDPSAVSDVGHMFMAIKPDLFVSLDEFKERMDYLYKRVVSAEKAHGVERIFYPGEIEILNQEKREREGIPWTQSEIDALNAEADLVGAPHLIV
ncbi:hypothetical protein I316_06831 [Kwoniella heveanensis BCC8398]|uniref:Malate dehydrogenase n=1 Tax=Kwoniella heveanensis BCC8398 TaxID=1296120 RepID=A0A1B9GK51_9TREE|nr:hypothetical protein I316_06831 [Kwoniella heveanensis BCC8398]